VGGRGQISVSPRWDPKWVGRHGISLINERLPTSQAAPLLTVAAASWIIWSRGAILVYGMIKNFGLLIDDALR
jgi:hypothetical protein